jgi:hypothetical protein
MLVLDFQEILSHPEQLVPEVVLKRLGKALLKLKVLLLAVR